MYKKLLFIPFFSKRGTTFPQNLYWRLHSTYDHKSFFLSYIVREQCGHTLKSSLRHILSVDRRDNSVFPTEGSLFKLVQEYAGIGKEQFVVQFNGIFVQNILN